jgi:hypothetical protein
MTRSLNAAYRAIKPMIMPTHNNVGGTGAAVTWERKGNGAVSAMYRLKSVILIKGER